MIWVGLATLAVLVFLAWIVPALFGSLENRIAAVGAVLHQDIEEAQRRLESIEAHAARQAKELYDRDARERIESETDPDYYLRRDGL